MEHIGSPETSVMNCHYTLRYVSQQDKSRFLHGGSLKSNRLLVPTLIPIPAQLLSPYFFDIPFNISSHLRLGLASYLFPSGFPHQNGVTYLSIKVKQFKTMLSMLPAATSLN